MLQIVYDQLKSIYNVAEGPNTKRVIQAGYWEE